MTRFAPLLLACAVTACNPFRAQHGPGVPEPPAPPPPHATAGGGPSPRPAPDRFAELIRDAEAFEGMFDLYVKEDRLYMAVPRDRLDREFLMEYKIAQGVGTAGLFGGAMLNVFEADVVALERHQDRIYLVKRPHRYTAEAGTPEALAVDLSFGPSVLESARIEATRSDSTFLINVHDWVVSDLSNVSQRVRAAAASPSGQPGNVAFDRPRSYLESVKAFPGNVNLRARLTYRPMQPVSINAVPDPRYVSLSVHYTLADLPEIPMEPRAADERVGYFMTVHKDFTQNDSTHFVRWVNRWRLEPGEPAGDGLHHPREPITYYLDRTIPEEYRPFFEEGIEAWNKAFEAAGFRDAIRAETLPEGADAEDIRYATLRWNTSDQPGYSAIGPSTVDPRTGEILDADMLFEASMLLGFRSAWRSLVDPSVALELALGVAGTPDGSSGLESHLHFADLLSTQGSLLRAALAAEGDIGPGDPVPLEYVGQALRWVVMHEVGHTLGLRHNFRSSVDTPLERLQDRDWAMTRGLVSSVMDYHAPNISGAGEPQGYYYSPAVGSADEWKIAFGYTADGARAAELARAAGELGHAYGTDEDAGGPGALDPTVNTYDLSADPLAWGRERASMIASLWPTLPEAVLTDNSRYADLTAAFQALLAQYGQALAPAVKYIGGQYVYRTRVGDEGDAGPFVLVPREKQREAIDFLGERAFGEAAFSVPPDVLARFGPNRWSHWGVSDTYNGRIDYPLHEQVLALQTTLLAQLTSPFRLSRIRDAELKFGASAVVTIPELMGALTEAVWSEVWNPPARNVPAMRRDLQRAALDRLVELVVLRQERMPADARAVARMQLSELDRRIRGRLESPAALDAYTRAHLEESRARIGKALEAGLELELRR